MINLKTYRSWLFYVPFIICAAFLYSCSNLSGNSNQKSITLSNLECYQTLVDSIAIEGILLNRLLEIRDSRSRGLTDPVFVNQKYGILEYREIDTFLPKGWKEKCKQEIIDGDDLFGIRLINNSCTIIEIDRFRRRTLNERFSSRHTIEFHRLIFCSEKPELKKYGFGTEYEVSYEKMETNCFYQITQLRKVHGNIPGT